MFEIVWLGEASSLCIIEYNTIRYWIGVLMGLGAGRSVTKYQASQDVEAGKREDNLPVQQGTF